VDSHGSKQSAMPASIVKLSHQHPIVPLDTRADVRQSARISTEAQESIG
jgi:hypothetical protein